MVGWSHNLEKAGGVQGPMVGGGGSHRLGKVGTSGEIRMSLEQGGPSHGSLCFSYFICEVSTMSHFNNEPARRLDRLR